MFDTSTLQFFPHETGIISRASWNVQNVEEVQTWCREKNVPNIVLLKDTEAGSARLKTWEKDRYARRTKFQILPSSQKNCGMQVHRAEDIGSRVD